ncbi:hypothetical protein LCGC14_1637470 [marine sediment metagenome]|uniref:Uncharacterized protein n=1 Tax=marine sediment metagenome TaxID=412755 RepID=A0A0F9L095_9ZZZZ
MKIKMTNSEFAREEGTFLKASYMVQDAYPKMKNTERFTEFQATTRQASKWRMKKGIAYKTAHNIPLNLKEDKPK